MTDADASSPLQPSSGRRSYESMSRKRHILLLVSLCTILLIGVTAFVLARSVTSLKLSGVITWNPPGIVTYHGHTDLLESIAYAPDGTKIASASNDGMIKVWNPFNGKTLLTFHLQTSSSQFAQAGVVWSPDGSMLAAKSPGRDIQVWDIRTGKALLTFHGMASTKEDTRDDEVFQLFWSPDSTKLAAAGPNTILYVWEIPTGNLLLNYPTSSKVLQVVWASDSVHLVSLEDWRNDNSNMYTSVHVWDVQAAKQVFTYQSEEGVQTVDWLPHSDTIVTTELDRSVHIWNAMTGRMLYSKTYPEHTWPSTRCSPDGTKIAIVSVNSQDSLVMMEIWHAPTSAIVTSTYKTIYGLTNIFWSPDGTKIATQMNYRTLENEYGKVAVWDAHTGKHLFDDDVSSESSTHGEAANGYISQVLWSPDSRWIAYGDETVHIFDAATHTRLYNFDDPNTNDMLALNRDKPDTWGCQYLAWSPNAAHIASVCHNDSVVRVWAAPR